MADMSDEPTTGLARDGDLAILTRVVALPGIRFRNIKNWGLTAFSF